MHLLENFQAKVRNFMRGNLIAHPQLSFHQKAFFFGVIQILRKLLILPVHRRDQDGGIPPHSNRKAPIKPAPIHHLVAARALPPSKKTHLYPAD